MKRRAIFFDRDNTLIKCDEYLGDPSKVVLVEGAADAVARARRLGFATVVFSNQSGVARGYFSEESVHAVNARLDELLAEQNRQAVIDRHEFCPFHPDASIEKYRQESPLRKPAPGMILSAAEKLALDLPNSWVIGDAPRDIEAGRAAGCRTILFTDSSLPPSPASGVEREVEPDYVCTMLKEALDFIERTTGVVPPPDDPPVGATLVSPSSPRETAGDTSVAPTNETPVGNLSKLESLTAEILRELCRHREQPITDFSVSKLMAGVVQVLVLAALLMAYINRSDQKALMPTLTFALTLQTMTIALLIMGRQR